MEFNLIFVMIKCFLVCVLISGVFTRGVPDADDAVQTLDKRNDEVRPSDISDLTNCKGCRERRKDDDMVENRGETSTSPKQKAPNFIKPSISFHGFRIHVNNRQIRRHDSYRHKKYTTRHDRNKVRLTTQSPTTENKHDHQIKTTTERSKTSSDNINGFKVKDEENVNFKKTGTDETFKSSFIKIYDNLKSETDKKKNEEKIFDIASVENEKKSKTEVRKHGKKTSKDSLNIDKELGTTKTNDEQHVKTGDKIESSLKDEKELEIIVSTVSKNGEIKTTNIPTKTGEVKQGLTKIDDSKANANLNDKLKLEIGNIKAEKGKDTLEKKNTSETEIETNEEKNEVRKHEEDRLKKTDEPPIIKEDYARDGYRIRPKKFNINRFVDKGLQLQEVPDAARLEQRLHPNIDVPSREILQSVRNMVGFMQRSVKQVNGDFDFVRNTTRYDYMMGVRDGLTTLAEENDIIYTVVLESSLLTKEIYRKAHERQHPRTNIPEVVADYRQRYSDNIRMEVSRHEHQMAGIELENAKRLLERMKERLKQRQALKDEVIRVNHLVKDGIALTALHDLQRRSEQTIRVLNSAQPARNITDRANLYVFMGKDILDSVRNTKSLLIDGYDIIRRTKTITMANQEKVHRYEMIVQSSLRPPGTEKIDRVVAWDRATSYARNLSDTAAFVMIQLKPLILKAHEMMSDQAKYSTQKRLETSASRLSDINKQLKQVYDKLIVEVDDERVLKERCEKFEGSGWSDDDEDGIAEVLIDCEPYITLTESSGDGLGVGDDLGIGDDLEGSGDADGLTVEFFLPDVTDDNLEVKSTDDSDGDAVNIDITDGDIPDDTEEVIFIDDDDDDVTIKMIPVTDEPTTESVKTKSTPSPDAKTPSLVTKSKPTTTPTREASPPTKQTAPPARETTPKEEAPVSLVEDTKSPTKPSTPLTTTRKSETPSSTKTTTMTMTTKTPTTKTTHVPTTPKTTKPPATTQAPTTKTPLTTTSHPTITTTTTKPPPITQVPTTKALTTKAPTTKAPTTNAPTTKVPSTTTTTTTTTTITTTTTKPPTTTEEDTGGFFGWWNDAPDNGDIDIDLEIGDDLIEVDNLFNALIRQRLSNYSRESKALMELSKDVDTRQNELSLTWLKVKNRFQKLENSTNKSTSFVHKWNTEMHLFHAVHEEVVTTDKTITLQAEVIDKQSKDAVDVAMKKLKSKELALEGHRENEKTAVDPVVYSQAKEKFLSATEGVKEIERLKQLYPNPCSTLEVVDSAIKSNITELRKKIAKAKLLASSLKLAISVQKDVPMVYDIPPQQLESDPLRSNIRLMLQHSGSDGHVITLNSEDKEAVVLKMTDNTMHIVQHIDGSIETIDVPSSNNIIDKQYLLEIERYGTVYNFTFTTSDGQHISVGTNTSMLFDKSEAFSIDKSLTSLSIGGQDSVPTCFLGLQVNGYLADWLNMKEKDNHLPTACVSQRRWSAFDSHLIFEGSGFAMYNVNRRRFRTFSVTYNPRSPGTVFIINSRRHSILVEGYIDDNHTLTLYIKYQRFTSTLVTKVTYGIEHIVKLSFNSGGNRRVDATLNGRSDVFTAGDSETDSLIDNNMVSDGLYIGGVPQQNSTIEGSSFVGCVKTVTIDGVNVLLETFEDAQDVRFGICLTKNCVQFSDDSKSVEIKSLSNVRVIQFVVVRNSLGPVIQLTKSEGKFDLTVSVTSDGVSLKESVHDSSETIDVDEDDKTIVITILHDPVEESIKVTANEESETVFYQVFEGTWFFKERVIDTNTNHTYTINIAASLEEDEQQTRTISNLMINGSPVSLLPYIEENKLGGCQAAPVQRQTKKEKVYPNWTCG